MRNSSMNNGLPTLLLPASKKNKEWVQQIADFADNRNSMYYSEDARVTIQNAIIDIDLYNGKLYVSDFTRLLNPLSIETIDTTREIQHYPIAAPIIDLLVGEEIRTPFEPNFRITNNIAIDTKEERLKGIVAQFVNNIVENFEGDENELQAKVEKFQRFLRYTYKDIVELKASALMAHYWEALDIEQKFVEGFRNALLTAEEIYDIDINNGEPTFEVLDRLRVKHWGSNSSKIDDSDIITIEDHISPGKIIDMYGDQLSKEEIERILNFEVGYGGGSFDKAYGDVTYEFEPTPAARMILDHELSNNFIDADGNIRVLKIRFKAYKYIKKVYYQDEATGEQQVKVVDDRYKLRAGEKLKSKEVISEWWRCVKIGSDIYTDIKLNPIRFNKISSLGEGHPGIVGEVYNLNSQKAVSAMSRMRQFQYLYNIIMDRLIVALAKNIGPILEMDMAKKPAKWGTKDWLSYIFRYNIKFVDSFKEVNKGPSQGQLAGNLASGRDQVMQLDFGNYIQQLVNMAQYLEIATGNIIGVAPQRKGAVENRETVGGVERATSQSSHITRWYSYKHEKVKLRAINIFIEAAKAALDENPKKVEYVLNNEAALVLDITEDDFTNTDIGIFATNSSMIKEHKKVLEQSAQAYMQNGGSFSFVFDVLFSESMSEKRRLIEEHEAVQKQEQQEQHAQQMEQLQAKAQADNEREDKKLELDKYKADLEAQIKLKMKEMDVLIANGKIEGEQIKTEASLEKDILKLQADMENADKDREITREQMAQDKEAVNQQMQG